MKCVFLEKYFIPRYCYLLLFYYYFVRFKSRTARLIVSTNIFVRRVTETSSVFSSKNILLYYLVLCYHYFMIFYFLYCSIDRKYEYLTETSNAFLSNPYFLNWPTFQLTDWLEIWRRSSPDVPLSHEPRMSKSDVAFYFPFTSQRTRSTRKIDILSSKYCHFFNFRDFAVSVVRAIPISILIEIHFDFLVSNNLLALESRQPLEPNVFKNMLYLRLYNFHNFR